MHPLVQAKLPQLRELCRKHHVREMYLFGSAIADLPRGGKGAFDPATSDVDLVVEFETLDAGQHADTYFGLLYDAQELFGRKVDLVCYRAIRNPYFLKIVHDTRVPVYAAA